jgi:hypothetical protein
MKIYLGYAKTYRDKIYPKPPWALYEALHEALCIKVLHKALREALRTEALYKALYDTHYYRVPAIFPIAYICLYQVTPL